MFEVTNGLKKLKSKTLHLELELKQITVQKTYFMYAVVRSMKSLMSKLCTSKHMAMLLQVSRKIEIMIGLLILSTMFSVMVKHMFLVVLLEQYMQNELITFSPKLLLSKKQLKMLKLFSKTC